MVRTVPTSGGQESSLGLFTRRCTRPIRSVCIGVLCQGKGDADEELLFYRQLIADEQRALAGTASLPPTRR